MFSHFLTFLVTCILLTLSTAAPPEGRIVNGNLAVNYQFPWHVSLTVTVENVSTPRYCGGSIIGTHYILTAATCVVNALNIKADMGSILFSAPFHTQNTSVYIMHPQFDLNNNHNNIAIVRLEREITYSINLRSILLIGQSKLNDTFVNAQAFISGFGVWQYGQNYLSENLRYAHKMVISNDACLPHFNPYIRGETMCTMGYNGSIQSGCYGDTGGALIANIGETWYQIGLISTIHGSGCTGIYPVLYTRISSFVQWIYQWTNIPINP